MQRASQTMNQAARPALSEVDLNFAPQFRPFYAQEISGYQRELDKLILPGEFRALTEQPRLQLQACRLRAGGLVVSLEATPICVNHRAEHAADLQHAEFLASFVIAGHGVIVQNEATLLLEPGDIIFRTTALPSEIHMLTDSRLVVVKGPLSRLLGAHSLAMSQFTAQRAVASLPMVQTAHRCLHHVFFDKAESNPTSSLFAEQALLALLASIYTSQALEKIPSVARVPADNWQILASYIEAHITDPELSVQAVADVLRVSPRWVHRLFKARALQYTRYVRERRLQLAKEALEDPRRWHVEVKEIAVSCGFQHTSHFIRRFHERFGMPPALYRKAARTGGGPA
ncbi:helix-turn-helix transcriptional regulator [Achromobacter agilis]|uniref:Transcriptional activator FeaR n=1 Tax=Achromobacter agilis TaxID=1353888 RepID=A0A446CUW0_9BURK|nr:AraC family transcriptional regulator [Achromobacter agilis]SSW71659.1 Transcriptional activator FeaR [Achromobacter agilis]